MQDRPETKTDERTGAPGPSPQSTAAPTSEGAKGTSEVTTYTKEQVDKLVSDKLAAVGRDAKALETGLSALAAERAAWQKEREEAEEAALRDDPDAFQTLQRKRETQRKEAEFKSRADALAAGEAQLAEGKKALASAGKERLAAQIAVELEVEASSLLKFTDGSEEAMRELASQLPKKGTTGSTFRPDSGKSAGGVKDLTGLSPIALAAMAYEEGPKK